MKVLLLTVITSIIALEVDIQNLIPVQAEQLLPVFDEVQGEMLEHGNMTAEMLEVQAEQMLEELFELEGRNKYLGCYKDTGNRDLPKYKGNRKSRAKCSELCSGFKYFGIQWDKQCFCGNKYGKYGKSGGCKCNARNVGGWKNCVYANIGNKPARKYLPVSSSSLSSTYSKHYPAKQCFDRNINKMCHGKSSRGDTLTATVTGKVEKIRITNRQGCCKDRWKNAVVKLDGKTIGKITKGNTQVFTIPKPTSGKHTFTLRTFKYLNIGEVEFYGQPQPAGKVCANEGGTCKCSGSVKYGLNGVFATKGSTGSIGCNNGVFGDPLRGIHKKCFCTPGWVKGYNVKPPYKQLGAGDFANKRDDCKKLCAAGGYKTCSYQCNGCWGSLESKLGVNPSKCVYGGMELKAKKEYLGCYKDTGNRDLPKYKGNGKSVAQCSKLCSDFKYFGIQWNHQCFCGNKYGKYGKSSGCKCDAKNIGGWKNCVYAQKKVGLKDKVDELEDEVDELRKELKSSKGGPVGPRGPAGRAGPKGADGKDGNNGARGPAGKDGKNGVNGPAGPRGAQGPAGKDGKNGVNGPAGPRGAQGPAGPAGPRGPAGPQGKGGCQVEQGKNWRGPGGNEDVSNALSSSSGECSSRCTRLAACQYWVFYNGRCWLKKNLTHKQNLGGATSGYKC